MVVRTEINGHTPSAAEVLPAALVNYGHITVMQVRDRATRGLDLHLSRLTAGSLELFGDALDTDRVRQHIRHALGEVGDATVRVTIFRSEPDAVPSIMVTVRPPAEPPAMPQHLCSVTYQRPAPHLKHTGSFGQIYHGRAAEQAGYDDALLVDHAGEVAESTIANVLCHDGETFVVPTAPALPGITLQLLLSAGLPHVSRPIHLADLPAFSSVLLTNSSGIASVRQVDATPVAQSPSILETVQSLYASLPWNPL